MHVLIAPDSFKGSLSALTAARAMQRGLIRIFPEATSRLAPIADGGEGTVEAMTAATGGRVMLARVSGPLGEPLEAGWGFLGDGRGAVVEVAAASGLTLLRREEQNPLLTDSYGTGELIRLALNALHTGAESPPRLVVGLGGSASNDGGAGCLRALGARFLDAKGRELPPGGAALARLHSLDLSKLEPLLGRTEIMVACDVDNPLCGPEGASAVFGPQKGATPAMVAELDAALERFADVAEQATGRKVRDLPGAGAAGGLGAAFLLFTGGRLMPGADLVFSVSGLEREMPAVDLVLTGEGQTDGQTARGKAPARLARLAKRYGKPVICISGALGRDAEAVLEQGIDALGSAVCSVITLEEALAGAEPALEQATARSLRLLRLGGELKL